MADNLTYKILKAHTVDGNARPGETFGLEVDQTLTQDATGTAAYLQLEAMDVDRVQTELSVSYVDHNTLQSGFRNPDDHRYLQTVAARYGIVFSRPGNGICHQVHLERFGAPSKTLLGSDSHTPTAGGLGMIAIGVGGQDVACAMAGQPFYLDGPEVVKVHLTGKLAPWVTAKDVILELLRRLGVKGGVGKIFEYTGPGVKNLSVPERATITNMGAELGATTSIFPADEVTHRWLKAQEREDDFTEMKADPNAEYDKEIDLDLGSVVPLVACPHSPDNVEAVSELEGMELDQVCIGSCTNSSFADLATVGKLLEGKKIADNLTLTISPGSRQVMKMVARRSLLGNAIEAGARILENACGPCIGMGMSPPSGGKTLRTFNRNFEGRTGTADAGCYLCSPQTAVASALEGKLSDPRKLGTPPDIGEPEHYEVDDNLIVYPPEDGSDVQIRRGPNIKPIPKQEPLADTEKGKVLLKVGDNITTDHIMPAGSKILPLRSNIPAISEYVFSGVDPEFASRARAAGGGLIVGGHNYGQGSSREHAALAPMYLGIKAVIAKSYSRIHRSNLINFGIMPLTFANEADYDQIEQDDQLVLENARGGIKTGTIHIIRESDNAQFEANIKLNDREKEVLLAGGRLNVV